MKKRTVVLLSLLLVGCSSSLNSNQVKANQTERFDVIYDNDSNYLSIFKDKLTKCKYIQLGDYTGKYGGITPLLKSDGTPDCN